MAAALAIPDIVLLICKHLPVRDVSSLSRTNKRLHSITLHQLYRCLTWRWNTENVSYPEVLSTPCVHLLLRALMHNPELGYLVAEVDFDGHKIDLLQRTPSTLWSADASPGLLPNDILLAVERAEQYQLTITDTTLREALETGDIDTYICLILTFLHDLRFLALGSHFVTNLNDKLSQLATRTTMASRGGSARQHASPHYPAPLTSVRILSLGSSDAVRLSSHFFPCFADLVPCFHLPFLQDLTIELPRSKIYNWREVQDRPPIKN